MSLSIFNFNDEINEHTKPLCTLFRGEHILGRGETLQITDKRISRNHVSIKIDESKAIITSFRDPVFFRSDCTKHMSILKLNVASDIEEGDSFGFFPDKFWFRVKFLNNNTSHDNSNTLLENVNIASHDNTNALLENDNITSHDNSNTLLENVNITSHDNSNALLENVNITSHDNLERGNDSINNINDETVVSPITVLHPTISVRPLNSLTYNGEASGSQITSPSGSNKRVLSDIDDDCQNKMQKCNGEALNDASIEANETSNVEIKVEAIVAENVSDNVQNVASSSGVNADSPDNKKKRIIRDRCWYGSACYRKNLAHKTDCSHPGDADYESDPDDDRPMCSFGANCYRRNREHRLAYKHPANTPGPAQPHDPTNKDATSDDEAAVNPSNILNVKRTKKKVVKDESSDDDYDLEDPFIDDGSEDEYVPPSQHKSQESDDDSEL